MRRLDVHMFNLNNAAPKPSVFLSEFEKVKSSE